VQQHESPEQHRRRLNQLCRLLCLEGDDGFVGQHAGRWINGLRGHGPMAHHIMYTDQHLPAGQRQGRLGMAGQLQSRHTGQTGWESVGLLQQLALGAAQTNGKKPLVLRRAVEQGLQSGDLVRQQSLGQGIRKRIGYEGAAAVQVAAEPAQRDLVHQGCGQVSGRDQRRRQRQQKPQLQADRLQIHGRRATPRS
jgi:hypothetical protein